jgi:hypothetical protein
MRRVLDFVVLNKFQYWVKKSESTVFFEVVPNLIFSLKSPENGPFQFFIHKAVLRNSVLENNLVFESKSQDAVLEETIKFLKYPHHLKKHLRSNFDKFKKMEV